MDDVASRTDLTGTVELLIDTRLIAAGKRGEYWAREMATGGQLRRLSRYRGALPQQDELMKDWSAARVASEILGRVANAGEVRRFWFLAIERDDPNEDEVACFTTDALGAWTHVLK